MIVPAREDLVGVIGRNWDAQVKLFSDNDESVPFDLSIVYDITQVELEIDGLTTITPTSGLTIDAQNGIVTAQLSPDVTKKANNWNRWRLNLPRLNNTGEDTPIGGLIRWRKP